MPYFLVTADVDLTTKPKRLYSWHFAETTGAAAAQILLKNGSTGGDIVARINLAQGTSASQAYHPPGYLLFPLGLYVDVLAGAVVGSVTLI